MKLWGDMTPLEQAKAAIYLTKDRGLTYRQAAEQLTASVGAIAGAIHRAPVTLKRSRAQKASQAASGETKSRWTENRLTEPWAKWRERRRAARLAERDKAITSA